MQRYIGPSNWDILAEIKRHAGDRTVLGSGDLFGRRSCVEMIARTGVDGVSIARGAIGNPWIFQQVRDAVAGRPVRWPSLFEQRDVLAEHFRLSDETYGRKRSCTPDAEVRHQVRPTCIRTPTGLPGLYRGRPAARVANGVDALVCGRFAGASSRGSHGELVECGVCDLGNESPRWISTLKRRRAGLHSKSWSPLCGPIHE